MKRYFIYDPKNREYSFCYSSKKYAFDTVKKMRAIYTKEKTKPEWWSRKSDSIKYKHLHEFWSRVVVRECDVNKVKDFKA